MMTAARKLTTWIRTGLPAFPGRLLGDVGLVFHVPVVIITSFVIVAAARPQAKEHLLRTRIEHLLLRTSR